MNERIFKILILLTVIFAVNVSAFAQAKKPKKTLPSKKAAQVTKQDKRYVSIWLRDQNSVTGTFVRASAEGIQVLVLQNKLTFKWKDIRQIIFVNYDEFNSVMEGTLPAAPLGAGEINRKPLEDVSQGLPQNEIVINRKPFEDLGDEINSRREKGEIDFTKSFMIVLHGTINADGKLDPKKSRFIEFEGDEQWIAVAKSALMAFGDSGALLALKEKEIDKIELTLAQNDNELYAILLSDMKTPERAATTVSVFNTRFLAAKLADSNGLKRLDEMSKVLFYNSTIKSEGRYFRLDFKLSKEEAQALIQKVLGQRAEKKKQPAQ